MEETIALVWKIIINENKIIIHLYSFVVKKTCPSKAKAKTTHIYKTSLIQKKKDLNIKTAQ